MGLYFHAPIRLYGVVLRDRENVTYSWNNVSVFSYGATVYIRYQNFWHILPVSVVREEILVRRVVDATLFSSPFSDADQLYNYASKEMLNWICMVSREGFGRKLSWLVFIFPLFASRCRENPRKTSRWPVLAARFKPGTSRIQVRSVIIEITCSVCAVSKLTLQ